MFEFYKSVDSWFLILALVLLGGWFVWSVRNIFEDFKLSVKELKDVVSKMDGRYDGHEIRLVALETRCDFQHRFDAGRRGYDPHKAA